MAKSGNTNTPLLLCPSFFSFPPLFFSLALPSLLPLLSQFLSPLFLALSLCPSVSPPHLFSLAPHFLPLPSLSLLPSLSPPPRSLSPNFGPLPARRHSSLVGTLARDFGRTVADLTQRGVRPRLHRHVSALHHDDDSGGEGLIPPFLAEAKL